MADLKHILEKTLSTIPADQTIALQYLEQAKNENFCEFIKQLSELLRGEASAGNEFVRQAAGLQLKNALYAKDDTVRAQSAAQWMQLPLDAREYMKKNILESLGTEKNRPSIAAQCVASVACIELPGGLWHNVISQLMGNVSDESSEALKESSLEALGYICQDIDPAVLGARSNDILTAIVHGMKKQEPSNHVRLAATTALHNSLEFTRANFDVENERHVLMQVVCEATQSEDVRVKVAALQCLVKIMSLYYQHMESYMGPALFMITLDAMKSNNEEVTLQGIEFWSNVCEEEINLACEAEEADEQGQAPTHVSKYYAKGALTHLVPLLTSTLTKQEEGDDEDEWNPAKAAGVCLMLYAQCVGDDIVPVVLPFVSSNIAGSNWRCRDAAIMAFGSILEGPDADKLKPMVVQALPMLITALSDDQMVVRDTTAWCIGRVCDLCQEVVVQPEILQPLLPALSQALQQEPRVAANVCWAISSLAAAAYENAVELQGTDASGQPETYILSPCFNAMVQELLKTTDRQDSHSSNLRIAAYEALMELIKNSPKDCYPTVQETTIVILKKLEQLLALENSLQSSSDRSQFRDLQALLCATLQSVLRKMKAEDAPMISDAIMQGLLQIMERCAEPTTGGGVMEDALMAVSTLIEVLGNAFTKYMDSFKPFLIAGLKNHEEYQVCQVAVGLVGDLCRAMEGNVMVYLDELVQLLIEIVRDNRVDKMVKPQVLSTFGDIAMSIGPLFVRYMGPVFEMLVQASQAKIQATDDFDAIDYINQLREGCLEAYTGILHGFKSDQNQNGITKELQEIQPHLNSLVEFLQEIGNDSHPTDGILAAAAGLIGDLVTAYGEAVLPALERESIANLLTKGRRAKSAKAKSVAAWATKEIRKLKAAA